MKERRGSAVWRVLIEAKARERRRVEADLVAAQEALRHAQDEADARHHAHAVACERKLDHLQRMDALTTGSRLTPADYLRYDAFRSELDEGVAQAAQAVECADAVVADSEAALRTVRCSLARLDAMLQECRKTADRLDLKEHLERDLATEEEAVEGILARMRHVTL